MTKIEEAVDILNNSGVIGMPTETVYGLAARIDRPEGICLIFETKKRPFFDPLIVHVDSIAQAKDCVSVWPLVAEVLAKKFWPGPLTLVLPKAPMVSELITSGLQTVGLRCPEHPIALDLIRRCGVPLAAPSANRFGKTSPTCAEDVRLEFNDQVVVLEGGTCRVGIESTILSIDQYSGLQILRPGMIDQRMIESTLQAEGLVCAWREAAGTALAPGQMKHHYMPSKPLVVLSRQLEEFEIVTQLKSQLEVLPNEVEGVTIVKPKEISKGIQMRLSKQPEQVARELYSSLRQAASGPGQFIWVVFPEDQREGPWLPIWDRLRKAASLLLS